MKKTQNDLKIRYYSTIKSKKIEWLWYPYIPFGKITVIQGDPGDGKTTCILKIAALLSKGLAMPQSATKMNPANILYQSAEDSVYDTIKPRLIRAGADCSKIAFIDVFSSDLFLNSPHLESAIKKTGARLLVLDPLQAYLGADNDLNRANDMRPLMRNLSDVAERSGCAIVIIGHMNKSSGAKNLYRGLGSIDITASARSVLLVARLQDEAETRVMVHIKSSLAPEGAIIAFEIEDTGGVKWLDKKVTKEELLYGEITKQEAASEIISQMLKTGPKPCAEIYSACLLENIQSRTVNIAKKTLGVRSVKKGNNWHWTLE